MGINLNSKIHLGRADCGSGHDHYALTQFGWNQNIDLERAGASTGLLRQTTTLHVCSPKLCLISSQLILCAVHVSLPHKIRSIKSTIHRRISCETAQRRLRHWLPPHHACHAWTSSSGRIYTMDRGGTVISTPDSPVRSGRVFFFRAE